MTLSLLPSDLIRYLAEFLIDNSKWRDAKLEVLSKFILTCKRFHKILQPIFDNYYYRANLYVKSINPPHIYDGDNIINADPIGNFMWLIKVKTTNQDFEFVYDNESERWDHSYRYFEENSIRFNLEIGTYTNILLKSRITTFTISIHYHANFGEMLQIVWWISDPVRYHKLYHVKLVWTEGDVWIGQILIDYYTCITYHYELCIDNGGPVLRKEDITRTIKLSEHEMGLSDIWNINFQ